MAENEVSINEVLRRVRQAEIDVNAQLQALQEALPDVQLVLDVTQPPQQIGSPLRARLSIHTFLRSDL